MIVGGLGSVFRGGMMGEGGEKLRGWNWGGVGGLVHYKEGPTAYGERECNRCERSADNVRAI